MEQVKSRMDLLKKIKEPIGDDKAEIEENILLNTIKMPKNLNLLSKDLPKSNYESSRAPRYEHK